MVGADKVSRDLFSYLESLSEAKNFGKKKWLSWFGYLCFESVFVIVMGFQVVVIYLRALLCVAGLEKDVHLV